MKLLTRRDCPRNIGCLTEAATFAHLGLAPVWASADDQLITPNEAQLTSMEEMVRAFMHRYEVPGFSVAIVRHGQFVYRQAFGWADQEARERDSRQSVSDRQREQTDHLGCFTLIERKRLKLNDFVFGRNGVLGFDCGTLIGVLLDAVPEWHANSPSRGRRQASEVGK